MRIGFVGLGLMGQGMCRRLTAAGHALLVYDARASAANDVRTFGDVEVAASAAAVAAACDIAMLSLPGCSEADTVMLGENGILAGAHTDLVVLDTTTIGVSQSRALGRAAQAAGISYLDAPVSIIRPIDAPATYTYMVGGDEDAFRRARFVLDSIAGNVRRLGPSGSGTIAKLLNQVIYVGYLALFAETLNLAQSENVELSGLLDVLATSSAGLPNVVAKYGEVSGTAPSSFPIENGLKYLDLSGTAFPGAATAPIQQAVIAALREHVALGIGADDLLAGPVRRQSLPSISPRSDVTS
jgi:3-hydroxyisobutyrate dehydrogenase-like beta-hydroxyacid dehydrogenase